VLVALKNHAIVRGTTLAKGPSMNRLPLRFFFAAPLATAAFYAGCADHHGPSSFEDAQDTYQACITEQSKALGQTSAVATTPQGPFGARLIATDTATVARTMRENEKTSVRMSLENQRVVRVATLRCESLKPKPREYYGSQDGGAPTYASSSSSSSGGYSSANAGSSDEKATQASGTNNQVAGVDEADFVKNDTKYIYLVNGSHFRIVDAFPGANMHEIADVTVPGTAKKLFVEGNRAVVYSSITKQNNGTGGYPGGGYYGGGGSGECTYGLSGCVPSGDGTETEISIFDLSNLTAPRLVRSIHSSSSLIAARRIGNAVHTVLGQPSAFNGGFGSSYADLSDDASEADINAAYAQLNAKKMAEIDAYPIEGQIIPQWTDSAQKPIETGLYTSSMPDGTSLTSVLSLDILSGDKLSIASVISRPGWVYASDDALYMAVPHQQQSGWGWYEGRTEKELSTIHKFAVGADAHRTAYIGSGFVKGRVLNQLAMDQWNGNLRVATTTGHLPSPDAHNTISILETKDGALLETGKIDNVAPTEDIRSVRFDGERGYIVTFKKTDPLFVFDLKDPRAPKTVGELKIPGFSTYIHMMDATHLLTIGYDAADQGDFAYFTGILLQIFDVSNPTDPKLTHKEVIGTRGSSSEALTNHLAFTYFARGGDKAPILALPMTICEGGTTQGGFGTEMTFSGLMVFDVTAQNGFKLRGKVSHPSADDQQNDDRNTWGYRNSACSNWWSNASSEVKRSIVMDDWVYSVSDTRIKANTLTSLGTDVKEVSVADR